MLKFYIIKQFYWKMLHEKRCCFIYLSYHLVIGPPRCPTLTSQYNLLRFTGVQPDLIAFSYLFFSFLWFLPDLGFLVFFEFSLSFSIPTSLEFIIFSQKNNGNEQEFFTNFLGNILFIQISFAVNLDLSRSIFHMA